MKTWHLIVNVAECHNCNNCVLATRDELAGNSFPGYSAPHPTSGPAVIRMERQVRGQGHHTDVAHLPRMCQHCDAGPCLKAGADGAVTKRADGIVIFDPVKAKGRRDLVEVCPYGAVVWNEALQLPQTWFFDAHLLDQGWKEPRAVTVCPTRALQAVQASDEAMQARVQQEGLRVLQPALGTRPRVYYRHLERFDHCFVAGTVVVRLKGRLECLPDAEVLLLQDGRTLAAQRASAFGDFRFDGLVPDSGRYQLKLSHADWGTVEKTVHLEAASLVLGEIGLN